MGRFLYHATLDENLRGIQQEGLKPVEDTSQCHWGGDMATKCLGRSYLSEDLGFALYYGSIIQRTRAEQDCHAYGDNFDVCMPEVILLRVPKTSIRDRKRDEHTEADYYVERTIPSKDIQYLHGEQCWKSLSRQAPDVIEGIATGEWREAPQERTFYLEADKRSREQARVAKGCARRR